MSQDTSTDVLGMVAYADGSFRRGLAGWGVHAYVFTKGPLSHANGEKQLPTEKGYELVPLAESCGVVYYLDAYATCTERKATNNVAELQAVIESFALATEADVPSLLVYTDSEYVQKNLYRSINKWIENDWVKPDGSPVANREQWEALVKAKEDWLASGKRLAIEWIKGHSGQRGNDAADRNALLASAYVTERVVNRSVDVFQANKLEAVNPLLMRSRLLFDAFEEPKFTEGNYYCMYSLGRAHNYGHKQHDTTIDKIAKTDIILGRRLAEAAFCILKTKESDPLIEAFKDNHRRDHPSPYSQPAILRLDNILTPNMRKHYMEMGNSGFSKLKHVQATVNAHDVLISKTLYPPRQAYEAIKLFNVLKQQLDDYCNGNVGKSVTVVDITDKLFTTVQEGKKKPVTKLLATITNTASIIEIPVVINEVETKLKLVLGLDLPVRNTLSRIAECTPVVKILVVANGPHSYTFTTLLDTDVGTQIYACPYSQFVLLKKE